MSTPIWIICPVLNNLAMSMDAIGDFLDQSVPTRVLVINQGSDKEVREALERQAELMPDRLYVWTHNPSLPSLSASWNRALDFAWSTYEPVEPPNKAMALVVNNDVRLHPYTVGGLMGCLNATDALFVSAVAVTPPQFEEAASEHPLYWYDEAKREITNKGGPDFSCFMISQECHQQFRFDEQFIPLFCEDLDYHRRMMLAGLGDRIFSVNLPYAHIGSGTLKQMTPEKRAAKEQQIAGSRAYYERKWGGSVNQETFYEPFTVESEHVAQRRELSGPTTPELQAWWQQK
jgi:hypothetical protein